MRILFDMYNAGYGYLQIAKKLNGMGLRTRLGNLFGKNSLHDLLINRRYIGTAILGKNTMTASGKRNNHRPDPDDMLIIEDGSKQIEEKEAVRPANISRATIRKYIERYRR